MNTTAARTSVGAAGARRMKTADMAKHMAPPATASCRHTDSPNPRLTMRSPTPC